MSWDRAIWIGGVARSGTSWVGQVFNSHPKVRFRFQPLFSYEFKGWVNESSSSDEFRAFLNELWKSDTRFLTQSDKVDAGYYPRFEESESASILAFKEPRYQSVIPHFLRRVAGSHLVALVRHPCGVLNSWRKNEREFPPGSILEEEWRFGACKNSGPEDYFGYYKWKEVANMYLDLVEQYPEQVQLATYEEWVRAPVAVTERVFAGCGLDLSPATREFLDDSRKKHSDSYYAVFKDDRVLTQWRDELDPAIVEEIHEDLTGTRLERFLGAGND